MNVASLELCKELHELSGWDNNPSTKSTDRLQVWCQRYSLWEMGQGHDDYGKPGIKQHGVDIDEWRVTDDPRHRMGIPEVVFNWWFSEVQAIEQASIPAYDLGYLLRKIPENMRVEFYKRVPNDDCSCSWGIEVGDIGGNTWYVEDDDTPEDAAAKLSIELFKQGILPRKDTNDN